MNSLQLLLIDDNFHGLLKMYRSESFASVFVLVHVVKLSTTVNISTSPW